MISERARASEALFDSFGLEGMFLRTTCSPRSTGSRPCRASATVSSRSKCTCEVPTAPRTSASPPLLPEPPREAKLIPIPTCMPPAEAPRGPGFALRRPASEHGRRMPTRITNARHIVAVPTSGDAGKTWQRVYRGIEVSGYHHDVRGDSPMLRPDLHSAGSGEACFRDFRYDAL